MSKEVVEFIEYVLTAADLKCKSWKVLDIDNDNIYLAVDSETNNYNIGSDGPYRALYKGQSNCNGYALSFMAIMRECGIETTYETGDNHAWNSVKLDGQWYNIDVTWDDSGVWDKEGGTRYDYFLRGNSDWSGHHHGNATAKSKYTTTEKIDVKLKNYKLMLFLRNLVGIIMIVTIIIIII